MEDVFVFVARDRAPSGGNVQAVSSALDGVHVDIDVAETDLSFEGAETTYVAGATASSQALGPVVLHSLAAAPTNGAPSPGSLGSGDWSRVPLSNWIFSWHQSSRTIDR
jgi:hypothetical protein